MNSTIFPQTTFVFSSLSRRPHLLLKVCTSLNHSLTCLIYNAQDLLTFNHCLSSIIKSPIHFSQSCLEIQLITLSVPPFIHNQANTSVLDHTIIQSLILLATSTDNRLKLLLNSTSPATPPNKKKIKKTQESSLYGLTLIT